MPNAPRKRSRIAHLPPVVRSAIWAVSRRKRHLALALAAAVVVGSLTMNWVISALAGCVFYGLLAAGRIVSLIRETGRDTVTFRIGERTISVTPAEFGKAFILATEANRSEERNRYKSSI